MPLSNAILATIDAERDGKVRGRTLLQKKLYFLSILCDEDFGFGPYYYGPYSSDVSGQLESLVAAGLVTEEVAVLTEPSGKMFEPRTYSYSLTEVGKDLMRKIRPELHSYKALLERINFDLSVAQSVYRLAVAAKVYLIVSERTDAATSETIKLRATELGWQLSDKDIDAVDGYLERLGLVGVAPIGASG
jgi:uncharacterized protein YwgA